MKTYLAAIIVGIIVFTACTNQKEKDLNDIKKAEEELYSKNTLDRSMGTDIIDMYLAYAKEYPEDTLSPELLFKAGEVAMNLNLGNQAILYYNKVLANYPGYVKVPECVFLKAFIYENQLGQIKEAERYYNQFIEKYPDHPMVKDARASLKYLGKTPEELIKIFQEQNK